MAGALLRPMTQHRWGDTESAWPHLHPCASAVVVEHPVAGVVGSTPDRRHGSAANDGANASQWGATGPHARHRRWHPQGVRTARAGPAAFRSDREVWQPTQDTPYFAPIPIRASPGIRTSPAFWKR